MDASGKACFGNKRYTFSSLESELEPGEGPLELELEMAESKSLARSIGVTPMRSLTNGLAPLHNRSHVKSGSQASTAECSSVL